MSDDLLFWDTAVEIVRQSAAYSKAFRARQDWNNKYNEEMASYVSEFEASRRIVPRDDALINALGDAADDAFGKFKNANPEPPLADPRALLHDAIADRRCRPFGLIGQNRVQLPQDIRQWPPTIVLSRAEVEQAFPHCEDDSAVTQSSEAGTGQNGNDAAGNSLKARPSDAELCEIIRQLYPHGKMPSITAAERDIRAAVRAAGFRAVNNDQLRDTLDRSEYREMRQPVGRPQKLN